MRPVTRRWIQWWILFLRIRNQLTITFEEGFWTIFNYLSVIQFENLWRKEPNNFLIIRKKNIFVKVHLNYQKYVFLKIIRRNKILTSKKKFLENTCDYWLSLKKTRKLNNLLQIVLSLSKFIQNKQFIFSSRATFLTSNFNCKD